MSSPVYISVLLPDSGWATMEKEADLGYGWVRFHWPDGRVAIAAPGRWKELDTIDADNPIPNR